MWDCQLSYQVIVLYGLRFTPELRIICQFSWPQNIWLLYFHITWLLVLLQREKKIEMRIRVDKTTRYLGHLALNVESAKHGKKVIMIFYNLVNS